MTATRNPVRAWQIGGFAIIAALVIAIGAQVARAVGDRPAPRATVTLSAAPKIATANGGLRVGSGPVTVAVYLEYPCAACEKVTGDLRRLVDDGTVAVELHPLASSGTTPSGRAANAAAVVADRAPARLLAFSAALTSPPDDLAGLAVTAGVPEDVASTFAAGEFTEWVTRATGKATAAGIGSTPAILVDGVPLTGDLRAAVAAAAK